MLAGGPTRVAAKQAVAKFGVVPGPRGLFGSCRSEALFTGNAFLACDSSEVLEALQAFSEFLAAEWG